MLSRQCFSRKSSWAALDSKMRERNYLRLGSTAWLQNLCGHAHRTLCKYITKSLLYHTSSWKKRTKLHEPVRIRRDKRRSNSHILRAPALKSPFHFSEQLLICTVSDVKWSLYLAWFFHIPALTSTSGRLFHSVFIHLGAVEEKIHDIFSRAVPIYFSSSCLRWIHAFNESP